MSMSAEESVTHLNDSCDVKSELDADLASYKQPDGPALKSTLPGHHFIELLTSYGTEISDAYTEYWFASGLHILSVVADKKLKVELKQGTIYPNLYLMMLGQSSLSRKTTVVERTTDLLDSVMPDLPMRRVPTEFSPEAFIEHMSEFNHTSWVRDEAAGVLSLMQREYMRGFKDTLMQMYDCKPIHRKLRTARKSSVQTDFKIGDPYLNILWATTDAGFGANTEQNDTLSGFLARFLYFFPQRQKDNWMPLEEGTPTISQFETVVRDRLSRTLDAVNSLPGTVTMHFDDGSAEYYKEWQRKREAELIGRRDGNAMQIYSRLAPAVVKLAMLFELGSIDFDPYRPIRFEYVIDACLLVDTYFLPTALACYELVGANAEKNRLDRIVTYLKKHGGIAHKRDVLRSTRMLSREFDEAISTLIESGVIEIRRGQSTAKGGRPCELVILKEC